MSSQKTTSGVDIGAIWRICDCKKSSIGCVRWLGEPTVQSSAMASASTPAVLALLQTGASDLAKTAIVLIPVFALLLALELAFPRERQSLSKRIRAGSFWVVYLVGLRRPWKRPDRFGPASDLRLWSLYRSTNGFLDCRFWGMRSPFLSAA
jgi:hypothetical protein